ncbi:MAG: response regulator transcription factor [Kutzneria sp.]|nr:response regulator transcription factor [Kutzneria sp.]
MRILVVDDEPVVRTSITRSLRFEGYEVDTAESGSEALELLSSRHVDAVVLDVMMPGLDGVETCRLLRLSGNRIPVLMLTARRSVGDRVSGLDAGADDYLVKPFALEEFLARLRALLRRGSPAEPALRLTDLTMDLASRRVCRGDRELDLTRTEFSLLELFLRNPERVLTRSELYIDVWGHDFGTNSNSLDVYVGYLRRKLEAGGEPRVLHTVRGVGYVLRPSIVI